MSANLVLVTRPRDTDSRLTTELTGLGFAVAAVPTVAIEPVAAGGPLDLACRRLGGYDWVVLTSPNGVRALVEAFGRGSAGRCLPSDPPRWAAVGPATAEAVAREGVPVHAVAVPAIGAALPAALAVTGPLLRSRMLLPQSASADGELPSLLRLAGADVDEVEAYRTIEAPPSSLEVLAAALDNPDLAAIVVASGSAVRGLVGLAHETGRLERLRSVAIISIGPTTSSVARMMGLEPAAEAATPTPNALAIAVAAAVAASISPRAIRSVLPAAGMMETSR
jgi:uroporphyrinogen-III synthase